MPQIPLGNVDWESYSENVSRIKLHNMYIIDNPASPDGLSRVSRPTLNLETSVGSGPIKGMWRQDATFSGDYLIVSGTELYRYASRTGLSAKIGNIPGQGFCQFSGTSDRVVIVRDGVAYSTDGTIITVVQFPDDIPGAPTVPLIQGVAVINSTFILTIKDTQRFYWISPGDTDPDPLNFASAERLPDDIEAVAISNDEIWFIGTQGPEVWQPTTDPDLPFQRINGRVYSDGCASRDTVVNSVFNGLPCLLWATTTGSVVMAQGSVKKVSNGSVEEALKGATNLRAWSFRANRHDFYILTADQFTFAYNLERGEWSRWDTYLKSYWLAHLGLQDRTDVFAGSATDSRIFRLIEGYDDDGQPVVREISGIVHNTGKPVQCASVAVRVNAGWSPSYSLEPQLELRWSDDQGTTWSEYVSISLGISGTYHQDTIFRSMGLIYRPSRVFEFRFAEKARFRIDYANMNEV